MKTETMADVAAEIHRRTGLEGAKLEMATLFISHEVAETVGSQAAAAHFKARLRAMLESTEQ